VVERLGAKRGGINWSVRSASEARTSVVMGPPSWTTGGGAGVGTVLHRRQLRQGLIAAAVVMHLPGDGEAVHSHERAGWRWRRTFQAVQRRLGTIDRSGRVVEDRPDGHVVDTAPDSRTDFGRGEEDFNGREAGTAGASFVDRSAG
jgi:hypothetical protein